IILRYYYSFFVLHYTTSSLYILLFYLIFILSFYSFFFFFNDPATTEIYTLSLHDALPICYSLIAYPMDLDGYKRLSRLLTTGNRRAAKGECDLTFDDLAQFSEGLIAIVLPPRKVDDPAFHERLRRLARLFGDRCYLAGNVLFRGDDARRLAYLDNLAAQMKVRLVATNDVHYHIADRRALQDVVTAIRLTCTVEELGFRRFASAERHLKAPEEMHRLFRRHPHAIERIQEIVERCNFSLDQLTYQYPVMYEGGETPQDKLVRLTWAGARA